eukprot:TRINITY_DN40930_c0_g1_i1.p1 TRINITY_DN40930_c0_g1~~TRINITY_DN40930_c0_g1_i1.p1  ORF type:complete len:324 (-),score=57.59 TRINITY_DN40930_c0_g1_i1:306-1181(-)
MAARWRDCISSFVNPGQGNGGIPVGGVDGNAESGSGGGNNSNGPVGNEPSPEEYEVPYHVVVEGFERARGGARRFAPMVFLMTIRHGSAQWPIRRRYRQVALLHKRLVDGLGRNAVRNGLPQLPPRVTLRSIVFGMHDRGFLLARRAALQTYLDDLLAYIPYVDQCEALRDFLCTVDQGFLDDYERLLGLEEGMGNAAGCIELLDEAAVAALPRREKVCGASGPASIHFAQETCVICQDPLNPRGEEEDVRVLPCGHEYHFRCISLWLARSNSCCVCQSIIAPAAVEAAPS